MAHDNDGHSGSKRFRKHDPSLFTDPDGVFKDFGYDLMLRSHGEVKHDATTWLRRQLRMNTAALLMAPLTHAVPREDFVQDLFLVPEACPAHLADANSFWNAVQADNLSPSQQLWGGPTFWFPEATSHHVPFRKVREFIEQEVVDKFHTPAHLIAHDPSKVAGGGDYHVHVIVSARQVGPRGLGKFEPRIVQKGCQLAMWRAWHSFRNP